MDAEQREDFADQGTQLYEALMGVLRHFAKESDVTKFQMIGALELAKTNILNSSVEGDEDEESEDYEEDDSDDDPALGPDEAD